MRSLEAYELKAVFGGMRPIEDDPPPPHEPPPPPTGTYPGSNPNGSPLADVRWWDTNPTIDLSVDQYGFHYFDTTTYARTDVSVAQVQAGYHVNGIDIWLPTSTTPVGDGILPQNVYNAIQAGLDWTYNAVFICGSTPTAGATLSNGWSVGFSGSVCMTMKGEVYLAPGGGSFTTGAGYQLGFAAEGADSYLHGGALSVILPDGIGGGTSIPDDLSQYDWANSALLFGTPGVSYSRGYNQTEISSNSAALADSINQMSLGLNQTMQQLNADIAAQQFANQRQQEMSATLSDLTNWVNEGNMASMIHHGVFDDDWS